MSVGSDLRRMGRFLEEFEHGVGTVTDVAFVEDVGMNGGPTVDVDVAIPLSADDGWTDLSPSDATIDSNGRLRIALETADPVVPFEDEAVDVTSTGTGLNPDGTVTVSLRASVSGRTSDEPPERTSDEPPERTSDETPEDAAPADTIADADTTLSDATPTDDVVDAGRSTGDGSEKGSRDVPPFRDPELLAEVYESCDTFAEMSDAIDMDVTGETVRRYMIDYGIHEPNSYRAADGDADADAGGEDVVTDAGESAAGDDAEEAVVDADEDVVNDGRPEDARDDVTVLDDALEAVRREETASTEASGTDEDAGEPVVVTDGIGIHDDVTVEALVESISRSNTVYEVKEDIGLDRRETRKLLRKLDLIDLVVGRIATEHERDIGRETILERLRSVAETESHGREASP